MSTFSEKLPEDAKEEIKAFFAEDCMVTKTSFQSALHVVDASCRVSASAVTLRRASWLQNSGIAMNCQQMI